MNHNNLFPYPGADPYDCSDSDNLLNYSSSDVEFPDINFLSESIFINSNSNSDENSLNSQVPCSNNQKAIIQPSRKRRLGKKKINNSKMKQNRLRQGKVELSKEAVNLKAEFYKNLTNRKKFKKLYVKEIHNKILVPQLGLKKMSRAESRNISLYFNNYARLSLEILSVLEKEEKNILNGILADNR